MYYDQPWPKFSQDGRVLRHPGCTIIAHLEQQGSDAGFFNELLELYREAPWLGFARNFTLLPPSSYHVTLFGLVTERSRGGGRWPAWIAPDASMDACARRMAERLAGFRLATSPPFRMRVEACAPLEREGTLAIGLAPANEVENARLRLLRDRLADALGVRSPRHEAYTFHVTLAYLLREPASDELNLVRAVLADWHGRIGHACPEVEIGAPEFCTFKDMFAFERQFYLR